MSEGPIKREREARLPVRAVSRAEAVCGAGAKAGRAYCGRKVKTTAGWRLVTCGDCLAARRADQGATS